MKKLRIFLLTIVVIMLFATLVGCAEPKVVSLKLIQNSFPTRYAVDEKIDLSGAFVQANFDDKKTQKVQVTEEMVSGFNTTKTGSYTLNITYKGQTVSHEYRVYNPENAAKEIKTTARTMIFAREVDDGIEYTVKLKIGDLKNVSAIYFTLTSDSEIADKESDISIASTVPNSSTDFFLSKDKKEIRVLVFQDEGKNFIAESRPIASIKVKNGNNRSVQLTNTSLSDGLTTYYLPIAH